MSSVLRTKKEKNTTGSLTTKHGSGSQRKVLGNGEEIRRWCRWNLNFHWRDGYTISPPVGVGTGEAGSRVVLWYACVAVASERGRRSPRRRSGALAEQLCLFGVACNKNAIRRRAAGAVQAFATEAAQEGVGGGENHCETRECSSRKHLEKPPLHQTSTRHSELYCFMLFFIPLPAFFFFFRSVVWKRKDGTVHLVPRVLFFFFCTYAFTSIIRSKI